ncbi:MAG: hypothetical protein M5U28_10935 [Sandaracinaceae bacterium]|nr:hypothetical protein [Sandaracinaceae bacterium]
MRREPLHEAQRGAHVERVRLFELRARDRLEGRVRGHAGRVHQPVEPAEGRHRARHHVGIDRQIRRDHGRAIGRTRRDARELLLVARDEGHAPPLVEQPLGERAPDPRLAPVTSTREGLTTAPARG